MNRREVERRVLELGGTVEPVNRTGEHRYSHPAVPRKVVHNCRRKDASRQALVWLRHVEEAVQRKTG